MRWVTHSGKLGSQVGILVEGGIRCFPPGKSMVDVLASGESLLEVGAALESQGELIPVAEIKLMAPLPVPPAVRDFLSFREHLENTGFGSVGSVREVWLRQPVFYFSNPAAIRGPSDVIPIPPGCHKFDFELEVAAVIGRTGSDLRPQEAEDYIAGYSILCDWSARDIQTQEMGVMLGPAKGKDSSTSLGPWLVTPDELADTRRDKGYALAMRASVNGKSYSVGSLDALHWSFGEMVAQASRGTEVRPGDVIGTGTVGRGCISELQRLADPESYPWLTEGDTVVLEVERLGQLCHAIGPRRDPVWIPGA